MEKDINFVSNEKKVYRDQLITIGDLEIFKEELLNEFKKLIQPQASQIKPWLRSSEVRKLLSVSPGTLQNLRINGSLPFSKIGGIVYYKQEAIFKLLEDSKFK